MDEPHGQAADDDPRQQRMAMGIALGTPFGVLLSLLLDNWGMLGVGVALGVALGAASSAAGDDEGGDDEGGDGDGPDRDG